MMAFVLSIAIKIGTISFGFAHEVECVDSITELTNTAVIKLPKKITFIKNNTEKAINEVFTFAMPVTIDYGYDGNNVRMFTGYVARSPKPTVPYTIECEDEMFNLKQKTVVSKSFANASLNDILQHIAPEYTHDAPDAVIGKFMIGLKGPETAAYVLKRLKDEKGLVSFFKTSDSGVHVLYVGKPYTWVLGANAPQLGKATYHLQKNVRENNLKYVSKADKKIKFVAELMKPDGKKIKAKFDGDHEGETITVPYYGITEAELETVAKEDFEKLKKDGYEGTVTGFGLPVVRAGMALRIVDELYDVRDESFFIEKVVSKFGLNGIETICTPSYKTE